jgi:hypothetical protein
MNCDQTYLYVVLTSAPIVLLVGKLIIQEPIESLLSRADKFVINKEVLDRLQESFASEILSIALIRSQVLNAERSENSGSGSGGGSAGGGSSGSGNSSPVPRSGLSAAFHSHFPSLAAKRVVPAGSEDGSGGSGAGVSGSASAGSGSTGTADSRATENTALASLSATERRKVIEKQQQQEQEIEEQLLSGAEAPVFWLLRYGSKLPDKVLQVCLVVVFMAMYMFVWFV